MVVTDPKTGERFEKLGDSLRLAHLKVQEGDCITRATLITEGSVEPTRDPAGQRARLAVQDYLIQEVQSVYRTQGVDINDKHIEVIVRQMMRKVKVDDAGDTDLLTGAIVDKQRVPGCERRDCRASMHAGRRPTCSMATCDTGAAGYHQGIAGYRVASCRRLPSRRPPVSSPKQPSRARSIRCIGLKENVIIGKLIPAGTGLVEYTEIYDETPHTHASEESAEPVAPAGE